MWAWLKSVLRRIRIFLKSIRFRLALWSVAVLAVILAAFCLFVYSRQANDLRTEVRTELEVKEEQMLLIYRVAGLFQPGSPLPDPSNLTANENEVLQNGGALVLVDQNGQVLHSLGPLGQTDIQQLIQTWQKVNQGYRLTPIVVSGPVAVNKGRKLDYLFLITPLSSERRFSGLMILGQPIDPTGQMTRLALTLGFGSLATLALVLAGGFWLAERAMSPVRTITRTARQIGETDLHQRLHLNTQDELGELANTFDAMLDRLQIAFDRQRQFTADASHELRTPLTIVGLETDHALERRRSNEEYERALRVIQSENQFMGRLVNDLLTLARMDAGQTVIRLEELDLSDIALDVVERLTPLAYRVGVEVITGELPEICFSGDRQYLTQMITNLVENAIKYAGGENQHVWVETGCCKNEVPPYHWVRISDDGPGIAAEHLPHLFDRFYRVDQSRTRSGEGDSEKKSSGSGLGLSIVQWIARAHGGEVFVKSEVGKGTQFEVRLPPA